MSKKIILIITAVIILGGAGYFIYQSSTEGNEVTLGNGIAVEETTDWKTYRNEEYGFEIKYPPNMIVQDDGYVDYLKGLRISFCGGEYSKFCGIKGTGSHPEIYLFRFDKDGTKENMYLYSFVFEMRRTYEEFWPWGGDPEKLDCKISPITLTGASGKLWECRKGLPYIFASYAFWERKNGEAFYNMNANSFDEFPNLRNTFNKILSTFHFLE